MSDRCYVCDREMTSERPCVKLAPPICKPCWISGVDAPLPDEFEDTPTQPMVIPAKWFSGYDD